MYTDKVLDYYFWSKALILENKRLEREYNEWYLE